MTQLIGRSSVYFLLYHLLFLGAVLAVLWHLRDTRPSGNESSIFWEIPRGVRL